MVARQSLRAGYQMEDFVLLEELGRGGEAAVWSGWDQTRQRVVAVKLIPTAGTQPALISADFERQVRSEEHTSELQSQSNLVCRLLLEKKKKKKHKNTKNTIDLT